MNYKRIFRRQQLRFKILSILSFIPDSYMLKLQYRIKMNRSLKLKSPQRFTEKLQLYKLYYRNPILPVCVDKYNVRSYVTEKGLSHILNDLYAQFEDATDINFDHLPNQFVVKTTDGGGGQNIFICKDRTKLNIKSLKEQLSSWKNKKDINAGREWAYLKMESSKIIIEKYLENTENPEAGISDYKIFCFDGEPKYIVLDIDRYIGHKRNFYTTDWKYLKVDSDCPSFDDVIPKPENLDELLMVSRKLSADFPFVRVDLYNINGKIIFGELTFYPWSGYVQFQPDNFDYLLGKEFNLHFNE